jgi:hypothetical protein
MSDIEHNEYNTPLTKQKKVKSKPVNEEDILVTETVVVPIKDKKPRKPKTEKQLEQFKKMHEARKLKLEEAKVNKKIEASKFLLEHGVDIKKAKNEKVIKEPKVEIADDSSSSGSSSSESDQEQIIVVKKKKGKKKSKKVILEEETSSESEPEIIERNFKHQRNKKSIIKIHSGQVKPTKNNRVVIEPRNFFVD